MNSDFKVLYTKCSKTEFESKRYSFIDTGLFKRHYFIDPRHPLLEGSLSSEDVRVGIPIEEFAGERATFTEIQPGVWENSSPVRMAKIFEFKVES